MLYSVGYPSVGSIRLELIVMLSPFTDVESYGNINSITGESIGLCINTAGLLKEGLDILCIVQDNSEVYEFYSKVKRKEFYESIFK